jgi:DNA primase
MGTGPVSLLKDDQQTVNYSHRIIYPINWNGEMVSFQSRDITEKHPLKYIACPTNWEKVHHKHLLYGPPILKRLNHSIIVEGAFDVWRMRKKTFATLGTGFTKKQLLLISKLFDKSYILFDPEPAAQKRAQELATALKWLGHPTVVYNELESDPADLDQSEVPYLHRQFR